MVASRLRGVAVVIPAAGAGTRLGGERNKVLTPLGGTPAIVYTVRVFQAHPAVERICVVARPREHAALDACFADPGSRHGLLPWIAGGAERQDSVYNGLATLAQSAAGPPRWVLVHDGARPCCSAALIARVLDALGGDSGGGDDEESGDGAAGADGAAGSVAGVVPVLPVSDTVRRIVGGMGAGGLSEVVPRDALYRTQTPQGFRWEALWAAHQSARAQGLRGTDDAQLVETAGGRLVFVDGDPDNVKITTPGDVRLAEWLLVRPQ